MYNYSGIKPEIIELLSVNRFNDSKAFYEEHKEELKQGAQRANFCIGKIFG